MIEMKKPQSSWKPVMLWLMVAVLLLTGLRSTRAEEGMWIPMLIEKYNLERMQEAGLKLSAEDIYSINQDCLKDALVIFGRGCTGEMVSADGPQTDCCLQTTIADTDPSSGTAPWRTTT